jgi:Protein of unknown function (DUF3455)
MRLAKSRLAKSVPTSPPARGQSFAGYALSLVTGLLLAGNAAAQMPPAIAAPAEATVVTLHAEGAQIYECKAGSDGKLAWTFREPIATLLLDGKTVGRHYAGPNWEHIDGSAVTAKAIGNAPGKTAADIAWLKLSASAHRGRGLLSGVTTVQRVNTQGGVLAGPCEAAGALQGAPYAADYVFLQKGG